jgi:endonuclease/exonuclease/phosphatase family metal-dependent hydrolase
LTRLPITRSKNYDLSVHAREPRGALRCDLDLGDEGLLHVFCLHLGLRVAERRQQEGLLLSADILRDAVRKDPVVVCGDFNYWGMGRLPALVRMALADAGAPAKSRARTYPSAWPLFRLDRIFVDAGVTPLWIRTHRTLLSRAASDHLPLVMRFLAPTAEPQARQAPAVELLT